MNHVALYSGRHFADSVLIKATLQMPTYGIHEHHNAPLTSYTSLFNLINHGILLPYINTVYKCIFERKKKLGKLYGWLMALPTIVYVPGQFKVLHMTYNLHS